jgi:tetratricopeptide (TPR) repeat protein
MLRTCYVSIPYGIKNDADGRSLDFDFLYHFVIRPAVQELDMECRRLDELSPGAIWHKTLYAALISSDVMISDVSIQNANVFYELGIRHALKRGRTLLISAGGRMPSNISYVQTLFYQPDSSGRLSGEAAATFRQNLQSLIRQSQRTAISDSPIYEFFPDLEVAVPQELESQVRRRRMPASKRARESFADSVVESPSRAIRNLNNVEAELRSAPEADPVDYLNLLRKYRDLSEWDRVIALAQDAPPVVAESPEVCQLLALALNRRGKPGDQDRAIALMQGLIADTGGDSESFGVLGRIYKDRYEQAKAQKDSVGTAANLDKALNCYREALAKNPRDYYSAINIVTLLLERDDNAARAELNTLLPLARAAVQEKLEAGPDFWAVATDLQLAAIARDWPAVRLALGRVTALATSGWMLDTMLRDLRALKKKFTDKEDLVRIDEVLSFLSQLTHQAGGAA